MASRETASGEKAVRIPSFEVNVAVLPRAGYPVRLRASEDERARVAAASGVRAIERLEADLDVTRWRAKGVAINGRLRATVVQDCVVTLEPVTEEIDETVEMTFVPEGSKLQRTTDPSGELVLDPDGPDLPETFSGDTIDIWPVVVEFLLLAIDPFPRAPGAELDPTVAVDEDDDTPAESPFAVLSRLKDNQS